MYRSPRVLLSVTGLTLRGLRGSPRKEGVMIHVCSLARLDETIATTGARHVVSLLAHDANLTRPAMIAPENHLWLQLHDISAPLDGYVAPQVEHVEQLIAFVQGWPREAGILEQLVLSWGVRARE